jgi:hypothetical protein
VKEHGVLGAYTIRGRAHELREFNRRGISGKTFHAGIALRVCTDSEVVLARAGETDAEVRRDQKVSASLKERVVKFKSAIIHGKHETEFTGIDAERTAGAEADLASTIKLEPRRSNSGGKF